MTIRLHSLLGALCVTASLAALPLAAAAQAPTNPAVTGATTGAPTTAPSGAEAAVATVLPDAGGSVVAAPTASRETMDNPYGLGALWAQGDWVAKTTLLILFLMSLGSWYILVTKLYESLKVSTESRQVRVDFFKAANLGDAVKTLKEGSAFRFIAESGIDAGLHHEGALTANIDRNTWVAMGVQRSIDDVQSRLQDGLAFLATVGSTAPFVGLFGTVWGIYNALTAIGIAGQASIDKVAGPVGESLIMTALGLAVAVPAVLGYNWLVRRNKLTMEAVRSFAGDVHSVLMGAKLGATAR
ncbi:MAG: MotA/TolQ/ExbB proton channel family protein [Burkholderiaceae bacterium]